MKRTRRLAAFQRGQHRTEMAALTTENAALEGHLMAALDLDETALDERISGGGYLDPWERHAALLALSAHMAA